MNTLVRGYRDYLAKNGQKTDPRPDWAITLDLGNRLRADKRDDEAPADFWSNYEEIRANRDPGQAGGVVNSAKNAWDSSVQALNVLGGVSDQDAEDIAGREKAIRDRPTNLVWENWQRSSGLDAFKTFLSDPFEITSNIVASGLAGSAPGMVGGVAGGAAGGAIAGTAVAPVIGTGIGAAAGAAAGTFPGALAVEYGNKYLEVLREAGADLSDPESIREVIQDPKVKEKAMELGLRRGLPVAAFDAISAALGGKFFGGAGKTVAKQSARQLVKEGAIEGLIQGGMGGAGEVAGAVSAGDEISGKAVFEEVVGELGPGAVEVGAGVARDRYFSGSKSVATPAQAVAPAPISPAPATAPVAAAPSALTVLRQLAAMTEEQQLEQLDALQKKPAAKLTPTEKIAFKNLAAKFTKPVTPAPVAPAPAPVGPVPVPVAAPAVPAVAPSPISPALITPAPSSVTLANRVREISKVVKALPIAIAKPILDRMAQVQTSLDDATVGELERMTAAAAKQLADQTAKATAAKLSAKDLKTIGTKATADRLAILRAATAPTAEETAERTGLEQKLSGYQARQIELANKARTAAEEAEHRELTAALKRYVPKAAPTLAQPTTTPTTEVSNGLQEKEGQGLQVAPPPAPAPAGPDTLAAHKAIADDAAAGLRTKGFSFAPKIHSVVTVPAEAASANVGGIAGMLREKLAVVFGDEKGSRSNTRTAIALVAPDGRVLQRGLTSYTKSEGLKSVSGKKEQGLAVQNMGKGRGTAAKTIDVGGKEQVLLNDLVAAGYTLHEVVTFADAAPGKISEDFSGPAEYAAARGKMEFVPGAEMAAPVANEGKGKAVSEMKGQSSLGSAIFVHGDEAIAAAEADAVRNAPPSGDSAAIAKSTAESDQKFAEQAQSNPVKAARVAITPEFLAKVAKAIGAKRLLALQKQVAKLTVPQEKYDLISKERNTNAKFNKLAIEDGNTLLAARQLVDNVESGTGPGVEKVRGSRAGAEGKDGLDPARADGALTVSPTLQAALQSEKGVKFIMAIAKMGGVLNEKVLNAFASSKKANLALTNLLTESGVEFGEFATAVNEAASKVVVPAPEAPAEVSARILGSSDPIATIRQDASRMIDSLRKLGADVQLVRKETVELLTGVRNAVGAHMSEAKGMHLILLSVNDAASPSFGNVSTLIHEVVHMVYAEASPAMRLQLERAITGAVGTDLRKRLDASTATNKNASAEEMLAESIAQYLTADGVDTSRVAQVVRLVKELYMRAAQSLYRIFGKELSDAEALAWFENTLRRTVGGDFDHSLTNFWRPLVKPTAEQVASRHVSIESIPVNYWDATQGKMRHPMMLPNTVDAAVWNLRIDEDQQTWGAAAAKIQTAAAKEIHAVLAELVKKVPAEEVPNFWRTIYRGNMPSEIIAAMTNEHSASAGAVIGGADMNDATNGLARKAAFKWAQHIAETCLQRLVSDEALNSRRSDEILDEINSFQKLETSYRDAEQHERVFSEKLHAAVKVIAQDEASGQRGAYVQGKLAASIRATEGLTEDDAIPANYQRVFRSIMDGSVRVFDYFQELAKLNLPLGNMTVQEIIAAIKDGAPANAIFDQLSQQRELSVAIAALARDATKEMDLLQLRVMTDRIEALAIHAELEDIRRASAEHLKELAANIKTTVAARSLRDRLSAEYVRQRSSIENKQRAMRRTEDRMRIRSEAATAFNAKAASMEKEVGAFSSWEAVDGAKYFAMVRTPEGAWQTETRTLSLAKGGGTWANAEQVTHDMAVNRLWLEANRANPGRTYNEVARQTEEISLLNVDRKLRAANRFFLDKLLMPLGTKFASTGTVGGMQVKKRLIRYDLVSRKWADRVGAASATWSHALRKAAGAAGMDHKAFLSTVYDHVLNRIENETDVSNEAKVFRIAERVATKLMGKEIPGFREVLGNLLTATKNVSELFVTIAEGEGIHIEDSSLKDPLTDGSFLKRHAIKYGWLTVPRRIRTEIVETVVGTMSAAGWRPRNTFGPIIDMLNGGNMEFAEVGGAIADLFTPEVVRQFVDPFARKSGRPVFDGLADANGLRAGLNQADVADVWAQSKGDVGTFIQGLFTLGQTLRQSEETLEQYSAAVLRRFDRLYHLELSICRKAEAMRDVTSPKGPRRHRLMDSRLNDILPPEHLTYDSFDQQSSRVALAELAYHAAFGRDGNGMQGDINSALTELKGKELSYLRVAAGNRRDRKAAAAAEGSTWDELKRAHASLANLKTWQTQLDGHFNSGNQGGPMGETRAFMELMQANMMLVLNQPKSGLWNLMSITDFPIRYGLGKSGVAGTFRATGNLFKGVAGSMLEAVGLNILTSTEYAKELGEMIDLRNTERLPVGVLLADIGRGGQFQEGFADRISQGTRGLQAVLKKGMKFSKSSEFGSFNGLHSPFQFISQQVAHSIAVTNVQTFETLVRKAIKYFEQNAGDFNDATFRFDAKSLGMDGMFFSDETAFQFFRSRLADYRLGDIESVARDALARARDGKRLLTKDQVLGLGLMAVNEISLESSLNTRPIEYFANPVLRMGGLMLGWPLSKMNQIHEFMRNEEGRYEILSVLKGLGILAAWSLPVGLAYTFLMDEYDDEILRKKSNLRGVDALAAVPLIGSAAYLGAGEHGGRSNIFGALERAARAGNVYGLGADFVSSLVNLVDPTSGQRDFSLDSRVLVFSQFANLRDIVRNVIHQEWTMTYQSTGRGLITALGGNGVIQYQQILNGLMGRAGMELTNDEAKVTARINAGNWLRAAGREAGIEMKGGGAGRSSPTPVSVWVREMQLAAYGNDRLRFLESYRNAVTAADGDTKAVIASWKSRSPMSVFRHPPSEIQTYKLYQAMDEDGRHAVQGAVAAYESFSRMIVPASGGNTLRMGSLEVRKMALRGL